MKFIENGLKRYFFNSSWLILEKVIRISIGLFVGVWVARYLGPNKFGLYSYVLSFALLFMTIATMGLNGIMVRELVKSDQERDVILGTSFAIKLFGALLSIFLVFLVNAFTSNDQHTFILILIVTTVSFFKSFDVIDFYYQSKVLSRYVVLANLSGLLLAAFIKIWLIYIQAPLIAFVFVVVIEVFIVIIGLIFFYFQSGLSLKKWRFDFTYAKGLLKDSWPLILGSLAATLYMKVDQLMIKEMMNSEAVGYYSVSVRLSDIWLFITVTITSTFAPLIYKAKRENELLYKMRLQDINNLLVKAALVISIGMFIFSDKIVLLLYGAAYSSSIEVLKLYIWSIVFVYLSNGSWLFYLNESLEKIAGLRLGLGAGVNILLNLYLIPAYGIKGAAYSTLISYSVSGYIVNLFFKKTRPYFWLQSRAMLNVLNIRTWLHPIYKKNLINIS